MIARMGKARVQYAHCTIMHRVHACGEARRSLDGPLISSFFQVIIPEYVLQARQRKGKGVQGNELVPVVIICKLGWKMDWPMARCKSMRLEATWILRQGAAPAGSYSSGTLSRLTKRSFHRCHLVPLPITMCGKGVTYAPMGLPIITQLPICLQC